ncbi:MAG: HIT domain-containing protein [Candidatus Dormibacteria bacterium]
MRQLWAPWRMAYVTGDAPASDGCFICAAADAGASDGLVIERAERTVTLLNRFPYTSGHVMVAPRRHAADLRDLTPEEGLALLEATQRALDAISAEMQPGGFNVGFNLGAAAGASVDHLHLHVVPRWGSDTNFMPVLADVKVVPEHLEITARRLRQALASKRGLGGEAAGDPAERV